MSEFVSLLLLSDNTIGGVYMEKVCIDCEQSLPATYDYYYKRTASSDGLNPRCKECCKKKNKKDNRNGYYAEYRKTKKYQERMKRYYEEHKEEIAERKKHWAKETKAYENRESYFEEYRKKFPDKVKLSRKRYNQSERGKENKRIHVNARRAKAKQLDRSFSLNDWKKCKQYFDNKCAYCGKEKKLEQEHFIPLINGGEYTINNIVPSCRQCNMSKLDRDFFEWYPNYRYYSKGREQNILKYLNINGNTQQLALL
jgi:5-methylcytosine-specific restriction endonuclease McrA